MKTDGTLWGTGDGRVGNLGDGENTQRGIPVQVATAVASVSTSVVQGLTLFVKTDGTLWAMGGNDHGQLGDGTTTDRNVPVSIARGVTEAAAGGEFSVYIKNDGTLWLAGNRVSWPSISSDVIPPMQVLPGSVATITRQPASQTVIPGATATLSVTAANIPNQVVVLSYQWLKDGAPINGATNATLTLANVTAANAGRYTVAVTNAFGSVTSNPAILTAGPTDPPRLVNFSIYASIASVGDSFIMGYVVGGSGTSGAKPLVIRAAGPSLGPFLRGYLNDPKIEFFAGATKTGENDNWGGSATISEALARVGAFAYIGVSSVDAAAIFSATSADNSVKISAAGAGTGVVLGEIYDATPAANFTATTPRLVNMSALHALGELTVGFVIGGSGTKKVLVRAIGPTLGTAFGVAGSAADPHLTLFHGQTQIGTNDNWGGTAELTAAFGAVSAFALPATSKDAAVVSTLATGNYSVQVSGVGGSTGVVLVEVYEVP